MHTLLAETVTHVVAVLRFFWVLKRFAWEPLLEAIDHRREHIRDRLEAARQAKEEADRIRAEYERRLEELEQERALKFQEAVSNGRKLAEQIEQQAREQAARILQTAREQAQVEYLRAREALQKDVAHLVVRATEDLLRDVLDDRLHQRILELAAEKVEAQARGTA